jgi:hypothetical protein
VAGRGRDERRVGSLPATVLHGQLNECQEYRKEFTLTQAPIGQVAQLAEALASMTQILHLGGVDRLCWQPEKTVVHDEGHRGENGAAFQRHKYHRGG